MTDGGTSWELSEAIRLMGEATALGDPEQIATAMRRHAEALSNQAQATLIPTLKTVLESVLKAQIGALSKRLDNSDMARLKRNAQFQDHLDNRFDAFGEELTMAVGLVQEVQASQATFQTGVDGRLTAFEERMTASEADRTVLHDRITRLEAVNDRLTNIEAYIAGSKRDEVAAMRREIDALKQARGDGDE